MIIMIFLNILSRICKLLFYQIKPVFVFDGAPPQLKRETLARRRMKRSKESRVAKAASEKILSNYLQRQAVAQKLNRQTHAVENALKQGAQVTLLNIVHVKLIRVQKFLLNTQ